MKNNQTKLPVRELSGDYLINEMFYSIQGEGPFAGWPAVFIRLAGCNLKCPFCDTAYQVNSHANEKQILAGVKKLIKENGNPQAPLIVITGGEPFRQHLNSLVYALKQAGFCIQIETNGTIFREEFPWGIATIVCSPKGQIEQRMAAKVDAFKYVARAEDIGPDGLPTRVLGYHTPPFKPVTRKVYLQPADEKDEEKNKKNLEAVIESCLSHGHILCLQLHKMIGKE